MRLIDADELMTEIMDSDLDHLQRDDWKEVIQIVQDAPTIQPHWIPVTERLPDKYTTVIVSCVDNSGDTSFSYTDCGYWVGLLPDDDPAWIVSGEVNYHVVAWMELPEPWRA